MHVCFLPRFRYVLHRLQRDSPPKEANRFSAFIRDQWAEGAGGLGKHMRVDGGKNAPWLKVRCRSGITARWYLDYLFISCRLVCLSYLGESRT